MKALCNHSPTLVLLLALLIARVLVKVSEKVSWKSDLVAPTSLDSWGPAQRIEATRQAANKYGSKP